MTGVGFATDDDLGYGAQAFRFTPGRALRLDSGYRVRQLPLVRPEDPSALSGDGYVRGRYASPRLSLVLFVDPDELEAQPRYRALCGRLRDSALGPRIAWDTAARRRRLLHATAGPGLDAGRASDEAARIAALLAGTPPFRLRVGGPWVSEAFNTGRLYLPLYPERHGSTDALQAVQRRLGCRESRFYAVGWLSDLSAEETEALGTIVDEYRGAVLLETVVSALELVATHDDLLLDSRRLRAFRLDGPRDWSEVRPAPVDGRLGGSSP